MSWKEWSRQGLSSGDLPPAQAVKAAGTPVVNTGTPLVWGAVGHKTHLHESEEIGPVRRFSAPQRGGGPQAYGSGSSENSRARVKEEDAPRKAREEYTIAASKTEKKATAEKKADKAKEKEGKAPMPSQPKAFRPVKKKAPPKEEKADKAAATKRTQLAKSLSENLKSNSLKASGPQSSDEFGETVGLERLHEEHEAHATHKEGAEEGHAPTAASAGVRGVAGGRAARLSAGVDGSKDKEKEEVGATHEISHEGETKGVARKADEAAAEQVRPERTMRVAVRETSEKNEDWTGIRRSSSYTQAKNELEQRQVASQASGQREGQPAAEGKGTEKGELKHSGSASGQEGTGDHKGGEHKGEGKSDKAHEKTGEQRADNREHRREEHKAEHRGGESEHREHQHKGEHKREREAEKEQRSQPEEGEKPPERESHVRRCTRCGAEMLGSGVCGECTGK